MIVYLLTLYLRQELRDVGSINIGLFSIEAALIMLANHGQERHIPGPWVLISSNIVEICLFRMSTIPIGAVIVFQTDDAMVLGTANIYQVFGIFGIAQIPSLGLATPLNRWIEAPTKRALRRRFNV
jgi:hypothetical protein